MNLVFGGGWQPSELDKMSFDEVMRWWQVAYERNEQQKSLMKN
ncbi:GpE family phage tail protein [Dichelobacter nodosus]